MQRAAQLLTVGLLITAVLAAVPAASSSTAAKGQPFEVGRPFPDLVLPDLEDGRPTSLASFRGRPLVLHVFASW